MKLLLDTHVWIWATHDPSKLGPQARALLESPSNELWVSSLSALELAQLQAAGRMSFKVTLASWVRRSLESLSAKTIDLNNEVALLAYGLPEGLHRDPADRILAASAAHHGLTLLTADERLLSYPHVLTKDARH